jgi:hypothetical protein
LDSIGGSVKIGFLLITAQRYCEDVAETLCVCVSLNRTYPSSASVSFVRLVEVAARMSGIDFKTNNQTSLLTSK